MKRFFAAYFCITSVILTVAILLLSTPAVGQELLCAPTGVIEQQLEEVGTTHRASREADVPGGMAHLWTNGATGSYTVLINPEPGLTCLLTVGQSDGFKEWPV